MDNMNLVVSICNIKSLRYTTTCISEKTDLYQCMQTIKPLKGSSELITLDFEIFSRQVPARLPSQNSVLNILYSNLDIVGLCHRNTVLFAQSNHLVLIPLSPTKTKEHSHQAARS